jgi:hypothetical protein
MYHPGAFPPPPGVPYTVAPGYNTLAPERDCECTAGWALFGVGFFIPLTWIAACLVPLCSRKRNDRRAAICSAVALLVYVPIAVALYVMRRRGAAG